MELDICQYLAKAKENKGLSRQYVQLRKVLHVCLRCWVFFLSFADSEALQSAYSLIKAAIASGASGRIPRISYELYVVCAEEALQVR